MSPDTIILASVLLLIAFGLIAVAAAIVWKGKQETRSSNTTRPEIPRVLAVSDEDLSETVIDDDDEPDTEDDSYAIEAPKAITFEDLRVLKTTKLENGEFEIVVDVDPNQHPATFRAKTLEEAKTNAVNAVRMRAAIRNTFPDY